jgi:hypothetical protein
LLKVDHIGRWRFPWRRRSSKPVNEASRIADAHLEVETRVQTRLAAGLPLRVVFAVNERAKWNGDQLVVEMQRRGWDVFIVLFMMPWKEGHLRDYEKNREFFASLPVTFIDGWDFSREWRRRIEEFEADIVFLQQPWGMKDFPRRLLGHALPVYADYGIFLMENDDKESAMPSFHPYLWRHFTPTEMHRQLHLSVDPTAASRLRVAGHLQLDRYLAPQPDPGELWDHPGEPTSRVVVAPHHSIGPTTLKLATFRWSHGALLELVKTHPEMAFVYKPHPRLRHAVIAEGVMTGDEYDQYVDRWRSSQNATVYEGPHYIDLFRTSDVLITDSVSFLAEYLPTGKPILRLVQDGATGFNEVGKRLAESFYQVANDEMLGMTFHQVVANRDDPLERGRTEVASLLTAGRAPTSQRLIDEITSPSSYTAH